MSRRTLRISSPTFWFVLFLSTTIVIWCWLSARRYEALQTHTDLAGYSQVVWNTLRGHFYETTTLPFTVNYLGNHFTPLLGAFVPFYALWPDPRVLLWAQAIAVGLGAWPLYRLAQRLLQSPWAGVWIGVAYLFYPPVMYEVLHDFHGITLGAALLPWALYALVRNRPRSLWALVATLLLIREDLALIVGAMGLYAFLLGRRRQGGMLVGTGFGVGAALILFVIPWFRTVNNSSGVPVYPYGYYYGYLGDSPTEWMRTALFAPETVLARVIFRPKWVLSAQLLLPLLGFPLFSLSTFVVGMPVWAYLLLVDYPFREVYTIESYYQAAFVPVLFIATILSLKKVARWPKNGSKLASWLAIAVLGATAGASALYGPIARPEKRAQFLITDRSRGEWALIRQIPRQATVLVAGRLTAPFSTYNSFYRFGGYFPPKDVVPEYLLYLADTVEGYPVHPPARLYHGPPWHVPVYEPVGQVETTVLARLKGEVVAHPLTAQVTFKEGALLLGAGTSASRVAPGQRVQVAVVWQSQSDSLPRAAISVQLMERKGEHLNRLAGKDGELYDGLFPTDKWTPGAVVGGVFSLDIPETVPPGEYELHVILYDRQTGARWTTLTGESSVRVGILRVLESSS